MDIRFFDDPLEGPRAREDVRIRQIGLFRYPEERRFMFGIELTPFVERPSIEVLVTNGAGEAKLRLIASRLPSLDMIVSTDGQDGASNFGALVAAWVLIEFVVPAVFFVAYILFVRAIARVANDRHGCEGDLGRAAMWGAVWSAAYVGPWAIRVAIVHAIRRARHGFGG